MWNNKMTKSIGTQTDRLQNIMFRPALKSLVIIIIFLSLLVSSYISACAESATKDIQNISKTIYLPLVNRLTPVYYVSPLGNDSNHGSLSSPFRTIHKATDLLGPGATIYIRGGTYHENISVRQSGTDRMPIQIVAFPGETVIIDGENTLPGEGNALIDIEGNWVELAGIEVQRSNYYGIGLYGEHDTVSRVYVHHNQKIGIHINGDYGIVQDSRVWRNSLINEYGASSSWSSGIVASRDQENGITEYAIIRRNIVWENWGQGINTYESDHVTIENNISHDNYSNNIYIHDETNVVCQRNFVYMNPSSYVYGYGANVGIMMGDERDIASSNITIINNIAFNNNYNYAIYKGSNIITNVLIANNIFVNGINDGNILLRGPHRNITFENNIVMQDGDLPLVTITLDPQVTFSNNLWSSAPPTEAAGPGDVIGNPLLTKSGDYFSPGWFKLTDDSPAIDAALSLPEVVVDYLGNKRVGIPDIGAYEFLPTAP